MPAPWIIKSVDILEYRAFCLTACIPSVTPDQLSFDGFKERNQAYIDGGLFSMSLMYALHHQELGCVPMCWLATNERDDAFRAEAGIQDNEVIMMLLGVGVPVAEFSAPASQRRLVEDFTFMH